jgi:hypothetical protein
MILPEIIRVLPLLFDPIRFQGQKAAAEIYDLRQERMFSGRKRMFSGICAPIGTNSDGTKSRCSQSCARMISGAYTYVSTTRRTVASLLLGHPDDKDARARRAQAIYLQYFWLLLRIWSGFSRYRSASFHPSVYIPILQCKISPPFS